MHQKVPIYRHPYLPSAGLSSTIDSPQYFRCQVIDDPISHRDLAISPLCVLLLIVIPPLIIWVRNTLFNQQWTWGLCLSPSHTHVQKFPIRALTLTHLCQNANSLDLLHKISYIFYGIFHPHKPVWPVKSRQMSIKSSPKMISLERWMILTFLRNCLKYGQNNCCHRFWEVSQMSINRQIWSHWH